MLLSDLLSDKSGIIAGEIFAFAGSVAPGGFLLCNGSAVSRSTYKTLFDSIGTTFGAGDGSTTFNLPNGSGLFLQGSGSQILSAKTFNGSTVGTRSAHTTAVNGLSCGTSCSASIVLNAGDLSHTHSLSDFYGSGTLDAYNGTPSPTQTLVQGSGTSNQADTTNSALSTHSHSLSYSVSHATTLSSTDTETAPAALSLNYIIKI